MLFINFEESFFILLIALILFGPKNIPDIASSLGYGIKFLKKITKLFKREIEEVYYQIGNLKDITNELDDNIKGTINRND